MRMTELMHWYNNANNNREDSFQTEVKSLDVSLVTGQQITEVGEGDANMMSTDGNRAARHAPGIALAAVVQTAAKADGKNVADSIQHVAAQVNERRTLTNTANEYLEKILALLMARIARVADKSGVVFSESLQRVIGTKADFGKRAVLFCEKPRGALEFSPTKVALLARGRAQVNVRGEDIVQYAALAEYVCSEIFAHAVTMREDVRHDAQAQRITASRVVVSHAGIWYRRAVNR